MATTKRQRQKEARRQKMEALQRQNKRRQNLRRGVIVLVIAVVVIGSAALFFQKSTPATVTIPATTTTTVKCVPSGIDLKPTTSFAAVASPQSAGTAGQAPTIVVPTAPAPAVMQVSDLIKGTGATAKVCDKLTMQYVLADYATHKVLQSSWSSGSFNFVIGEQQVIPGWDEGILGMKVGGRREMVIPPSLAYGATGQPGSIAKNDTLIFVVDLLKIG